MNVVKGCTSRSALPKNSHTSKEGSDLGGIGNGLRGINVVVRESVTVKYEKFGICMTITRCGDYSLFGNSRIGSILIFRKPGITVNLLNLSGFL